MPYDGTGLGALRAWIPQNTRFVQDEDHLTIVKIPIRTGLFVLMGVIGRDVAERRRGLPH